MSKVNISKNEISSPWLVTMLSLFDGQMVFRHANRRLLAPNHTKKGEVAQTEETTVSVMFKNQVIEIAESRTQYKINNVETSERKLSFLVKVNNGKKQRFIVEREQDEHTMINQVYNHLIEEIERQEEDNQQKSI